ncbi:MAG TPA: 6-carboxytetrahydropterin synthase [Planctomycetota bacterium]|nr:6-carboxytetrahydropterin synthase [Planctomycetota bacterium]
MKVVYLTRAYSMSAGHRLFDPRLDDDTNLELFGKCSLAGGHGHNYRIELTVKGTPDPETGRVATARDIDQVVEEEVFERLDHRSLNDVIPSEFGPAPTTEVLVLELWRALQPRIAPLAALHSLRVSETAKNTFEYFGPG